MRRIEDQWLKNLIRFPLFLFHEPENLKSELVFKADRIILSVQKLE